jgi:hypothetical protein
VTLPSLVLVLACGGSRGQWEAIDLAAALPLAEIEAEVAEIDFGTAAARRHLGAGWSWNESAGDRTFVWATGESAEITFFAAAPRAVGAALTLFPFDWPGAPPQTVEVVAGGRTVARLELPPGSSEHRFSLPLTAGGNKVLFRFGRHRSPAAVGAAADRRRDWPPVSSGCASTWCRPGKPGPRATAGCWCPTAARSPSISTLPVRPG